MIPETKYARSEGIHIAYQVYLEAVRGAAVFLIEGGEFALDELGSWQS